MRKHILSILVTTICAICLCSCNQGTEQRTQQPKELASQHDEMQPDYPDVTVVEKTESDSNENFENVVENENQKLLYNKGNTTIFLKSSLPTTVSYAIGGEIDSSCKVLNVSVGQESYMGIHINVECEKTYEKETGTYNAFCWKLYDSSNMIVEDGQITNYNVSIGERFKETFTIFEDLSSGTYTLVFTDLN